MENNSKQIESLLEKTMDYVKTSYELIRLKTIDKLAELISLLIPRIITFVLILSFFIFFNLGLAFLLGELIGKLYIGFFIVAGFYCFVAVVLLLLNPCIKKKIYNGIIRQLTSK